MKYLTLVGDGMADFPQETLARRTPLEAAATPAMDWIAQHGIAGELWPIPPDLAPGSDIGNLSLFGYDPHTTSTGRAALEAASMGVHIGQDEVAFRCNLVTLEDAIMKSFTAGHIPTPDARELIAALDHALSHDSFAAFHPGVSYRHLTIVTPSAATPDDLLETRCTPPHDITDQPCLPFLPSGPAGAFLRGLMERSQPVLQAHPVNRRRIAAGALPATSIWLWGQGSAINLDTYLSRFGLTGAVISAVDLVHGIGACAGLEAIKVPGATGYLDTNYAGKVEAALRALERHDFVYLHVEAPDEASHQGSAELKIRAIEDFDRFIVAPCLDHVRTRRGFRVLVAPDHVTALSTKTHAAGPVPFALCGDGIEPHPAAAFNEPAARATGLVVKDAYRLVPAMITCQRLTATRLNLPPSSCKTP